MLCLLPCRPLIETVSFLSSTLSGLGRLTPPRKPIPFPLHVPSVTFSPNFASLSIAADNFVDDSPSLFVIFSASLRAWFKRVNTEMPSDALDVLGRVIGDFFLHVKKQSVT